MRYAIIFLLMIGLLPQSVTAQQGKVKKKKSNVHATALPPWAAAHNYDAQAQAYFPDYYTFYDPNKGGYMFLENGKWTFTPTMPPYMNNADLAKTKVQILKGVDLNLRPETDYPRYMKLYPAEHQYNDVPVPAASTYPGNP